MGIIIEASSNVVLENNIIADFIQQGIWLKERSSNITIDDNWVHQILSEVDELPKVREYPIL
jgi:parallel beta-helix repeat protein